MSSAMLAAAAVAVVIGWASVGSAQRSTALESLRDPSWRTRLAAAHAAGINGDRAAVPQLVRMLHADAEAQVRAECAVVVSRLMGESARSELELALRDGSRVVRQAAAAAIAWLGPALPTGCGAMVEAVDVAGWTLHLCSDGSVHRSRQPGPSGR
jgi:HEAT repeat protein